MQHNRIHFPAWLAGFIAILLAGSITRAACAEVFVLHTGGRIEGRLLNPNQSPRETFVIRPTFGGEIALPHDQVAQVITSSPEEQKYAQLRPTYPDTADGHWQLAEWCLKNRLLDQRRVHLERTIELDPEHEAARSALGYRKVQGTWMTRDEEMAARGMILYKGRYRTQQEIALWEQEQKQNLAEREWQAKLKRWYDWLNTPSKFQQAVQNIRAIRDPFAVPALTKFLAEEKNPQRRILFIEALAHNESPSALVPLVKVSLSDPEEEVRLTCLDHLIAKKSPDALKLYIAALNDKSNTKVNRAASALRLLNDSEAVGPLIDALVTRHKYKIVTGSPGQMSSTFSGNGAGGFSFGSKPPQIIERNQRNEQVLSALLAITGQNFSYDIGAWKRWHAAQKNALDVDTRRD